MKEVLYKEGGRRRRGEKEGEEEGEEEERTFWNAPLAVTSLSGA